MNLIFRKAALDDIRPALALWFRVWDEFIAPEKAQPDSDYDDIVQNSGLLKKYESGEQDMLIALDGEKIIGVAGADFNASYIKPPICVAREYHRQGIANELLHRMVCELKMRGGDIIKVDSSRYAVPFYENFGFVQTGAEQQHDGFVSIPMEYTPREICDVLDANGGKTGRLYERGKKMAAGDYHLVVHIWIMNGNGEFLISQREGWQDGMWQTTSGAAVAGDNSLTAALRETKEELGLDLAPENGLLSKQYISGNVMIDVWLYRQDVDLCYVRFQAGETRGAMWASKEKIKQMAEEGIFLWDWYSAYIDEVMEKWA